MQTLFFGRTLYFYSNLIVLADVKIFFCIEVTFGHISRKKFRNRFLGHAMLILSILYTQFEDFCALNNNRNKKFEFH